MLITNEMTSATLNKRLKLTSDHDESQLAVDQNNNHDELDEHGIKLEMAKGSIENDDELNNANSEDGAAAVTSKSTNNNNNLSRSRTRSSRSNRQSAASKSKRLEQQEIDNFGVDDLSDDEGEQDDEADEDYEEDEEDDEDEDDDDNDEETDDVQPNSNNNKSRRSQANLQDQLAASGPTGVAAAAAIATVRKRRKPHTFETNPSVRKRQQTRLIRKLRACIDEYTARVGQQAVVLITMPGKTAHNFKVFGAQPLESVVRSCKQEIMSELEQAVLEQTPIKITSKSDSSKHELPPLVIEGIPTPVEKMTQAQLRAFIPLMLKYSTGRGKPGWGKESTRPPWWPTTLPWANVRSDARDEDEKQRVSWTTTLREIVTNCYKYHGREDLLPIFDEDEEAAANETSSGGRQLEDGTKLSSSQNNSIEDRHSTTSCGGVLRSQRPLGSASTRLRSQQQQQHHQQQQQQQHIMSQTSSGAYYTTAQQQPYVTANSASGQFMQTIQNPDGSVSLIQVDPANAQILTLPDGTQVRAVRLQTCLGAPGSDGELQTIGNSVQLQADPQQQHQQTQIMDGQQAEMGPDGQIILTSEDGTQSCYPMSQLVSIPASVYQQFAASGQPLQILTADGTSLSSANAIQIHTLQEAQEISAAEAAAAEGGDSQQHMQQVEEDGATTGETNAEANSTTNGHDQEQQQARGNTKTTRSQTNAAESTETTTTTSDNASLNGDGFFSSN